MRALNYGKSLPDTDRQRERDRCRGSGRERVEFCFSCIVCHSHYRNTKIPKYQICTLIFQFRNVFAVISRFIAQQRDSSRLIRLLSRYLNCLARLVVIWRKSLFKMIKSGTWKRFPIAFSAGIKVKEYFWTSEWIIQLQLLSLSFTLSPFIPLFSQATLFNELERLEVQLVH